VALLLRAKGGIDGWLADNFPFVSEGLVKKSVIP
jgi:hypothetical protein